MCAVSIGGGDAGPGRLWTANSTSEGGPSHLLMPSKDCESEPCPPSLTSGDDCRELAAERPLAPTSILRFRPSTHRVASSLVGALSISVRLAVTTAKRCSLSSCRAPGKGSRCTAVTSLSAHVHDGVSSLGLSCARGDGARGLAGAWTCSAGANARAAV